MPASVGIFVVVKFLDDAFVANKTVVGVFQHEVHYVFFFTTNDADCFKFLDSFKIIKDLFSEIRSYFCIACADRNVLHVIFVVYYVVITLYTVSNITFKLEKTVLMLVDIVVEEDKFF